MWFQTWVKTRALASDLCVIHLISICEGLSITGSPPWDLGQWFSLRCTGDHSSASLHGRHVPQLSDVRLDWTDRQTLSHCEFIWEQLLWITPHIALNTMFCLIEDITLILEQTRVFILILYIYIYLIKTKKIKITISCYILLSWHKSCHIMM